MKKRYWGELFLEVFVELGGLNPSQAVLEPGCGTGRMAEPLARYLGERGSYDGFDVVPGAIKWCQKNIRRPNFRFRHVDVLNPYYNPDGRLDAQEFKFPYPDENFDFVFLTSVFTHMLPPEVRHYLSEIRRVLRPGGRCLMTVFLVNQKALDSVRAGHAERQFAHQGDGYCYDVAGKPAHAVAYREEDLLGLLNQTGLELDTIRYGRWRDRRTRRSQDIGQDIVVARS
jgi:ubiquinone/menaquinone biosynthesis C-methylase UbiE